MKLHVKLSGLQGALEKIHTASVSIDEAAQQALNQEARSQRSAHISQALAAGTGLNAGLIISRMRMKPAKKGDLEAVLTPSSYGEDMRLFKYSSQSVGGSGTRARILVEWFGEHKVGAGFINPRGAQQAPLRTRSHKGKLKIPRRAIGFSVAAMYKRFMNDDRLAAIRDSLEARLLRIIESKQ